MTKRKKQKKTKVKLLPSLCAAAFILYAATTLINLQFQTNELTQVLSSVNDKITQEEARAADLQSKLGHINTDEYYMKRARELGYVFPDETVFMDMAGN